MLAFAGAHACLVLGARRSTDDNAIELLVALSVGLGTFDAALAIAAISGLADEVGEGEAKLVAVSLVLLVLTTVLPPILRRIQTLRERPSPPVAATEPSLPARRDGLELLASEAVSIAERIDALNRGSTIRREEIRREVERLRNLARTFQD